MTTAELLKLYTAEQLIEHCSHMYCRFTTLDRYKIAPQKAYSSGITVYIEGSSTTFYYHSPTSGTNLLQSDIDAIIAKMDSNLKPVPAPRKSRFEPVEVD